MIDINVHLEGGGVPNWNNMLDFTQAFFVLLLEKTLIVLDPSTLQKGLKIVCTDRLLAVFHVCDASPQPAFSIPLFYNIWSLISS